MITVTGWKPGFNKVQFNKLLRSHASLSLSEAKDKVDLLLKGGEVKVPVAQELEAEFCEKAKELGAVLN